jgi:hypothetical protein
VSWGGFVPAWESDPAKTSTANKEENDFFMLSRVYSVSPSRGRPG